MIEQNSLACISSFSLLFSGSCNIKIMEKNKHYLEGSCHNFLVFSAEIFPFLSNEMSVVMIDIIFWLSYCYSLISTVWKCYQFLGNCYTWQFICWFRYFTLFYDSRFVLPERDWEFGTMNLKATFHVEELLAAWKLVRVFSCS